MATEIVGRRHLRAWFDGLEESEQLTLWNEYSSYVSGTEVWGEDYEWEDILERTGLEGVDLLRAALFGDAKFVTTYVWLNGYGNLMSADLLEDTPYNREELLDWLKDNNSVWKDTLRDKVLYTDRNDDKEIVIEITKYEEFLIRNAFLDACSGDPDEICNIYFRDNWMEMFEFFKTYRGICYPADDNVEQIYLIEEYENDTWEEALGKTREMVHVHAYQVLHSRLTKEDYKEYWRNNHAKMCNCRI